MKIKTTKSVAVETEIEIEAPYFFKREHITGDTYYAIIEDYAVCIYTNKGGSISTYCVQAVAQWLEDENHVKCSREEFMAVYEQVTLKIKSDLSK